MPAILLGARMYDAFFPIIFINRKPTRLKMSQQQKKQEACMIGS
jgi:hypothetical protein